MERKINITNTDTRNEKQQEKKKTIIKTSLQRAHMLIISQVNSIKPLRNELHCLNFSNTNGENTNCRFFFKNLNMIVTQKSGKHGKKRKLQSNLAHEY